MGHLSADHVSAGDNVGTGEEQQGGVLVDAVSVAAGSLLCVFGVIWVGADFSAGVVASLVLQHAVWDGDAAGVCAGGGICGELSDFGGAGVQAKADRVRDRCAAGVCGALRLG